MKEGSKYLEKERERQRKYFSKTKELLKKELKERREAVRLRVKKHCQFSKEAFYLIEATRDMSSTSSPNKSMPLIVSMPFPKRGKSSRKRKHQSQNRLQKNIAKLETKRNKVSKKATERPVSKFT